MHYAAIAEPGGIICLGTMIALNISWQGESGRESKNNSPVAASLLSWHHLEVMLSFLSISCLLHVSCFWLKWLERLVCVGRWSGHSARTEGWAGLLGSIGQHVGANLHLG